MPECRSAKKQQTGPLGHRPMLSTAACVKAAPGCPTRAPRHASLRARSPHTRRPSLPRCFVHITPCAALNPQTPPRPPPQFYCHAVSYHQIHNIFLLLCPPPPPPPRTRTPTYGGTWRRTSTWRCPRWGPLYVLFVFIICIYYYIFFYSLVELRDMETYFNLAVPEVGETVRR